jgi:hypothetical protein
MGTLAPLRPRLDCERDSKNRPSVSPAPPGFAERSNFPLRRRMAVRPAPMEFRRPARPGVCRAASQDARPDHGWPYERWGPTASHQEWPFQKAPGPAATAGVRRRKAVPAARGRASVPSAPPRFGRQFRRRWQRAEDLETKPARRESMRRRRRPPSQRPLSFLPPPRARALVVGKEASAVRVQRHSAARPNPRGQLARRRQPQTDRVRRTGGAGPAPPCRAKSPAAAPASARRTARTAHIRVKVPAWRVSVEPPACLSLFHRSTIGSARGASVHHRRLAATPDSDDDRRPPRSLPRSTLHRRNDLANPRLKTCRTNASSNHDRNRTKFTGLCPAWQIRSKPRKAAVPKIAASGLFLTIRSMGRRGERGLANRGARQARKR